MHLFNYSIKQQNIIRTAIENKPINQPNYYKNIFLNNYKNYYKKGGQRRNKKFDNLYTKLTGKEPIKIDKSKRKKSGKKRKKNNEINPTKLLYLPAPTDNLRDFKKENKSSNKKGKYKKKSNKKINDKNIIIDRENKYKKINERTAYINLETNQLEISLTKEKYKNMEESKRQILKAYFKFSPTRKRWVSKAKKDNRGALRAAKYQLGYDNIIDIKKKLTPEQSILKEIDKHQNKIKSYEKIVVSKEKKANDLKAEFRSYSGDISYMTQPIIRGHAGSERFGRYREKVFNRFGKGVEESKKADYYREKIDISKSEIKDLKEKLKNIRGE
jgi:hypothetical protein